MQLRVLLAISFFSIVSFASGNINPAMRFKKPKLVINNDDKCKEGESVKDCLARIQANTQKVSK